MRTTSTGATLACVGLLAFATACGEREEPTGALPPDLPATVQHAASEPFVSADVPSRVVALDDGVAATAYELGANLVGTPTDAVDPSIELVSDATGEIDLAAVRALEPDLILATQQTDAQILAALTANPGVPVYTAPSFEAEDLIQATYELAIILGDPVLAREVSASVRDELEGASASVAGLEPVRVFIDTGLRVPPDLDPLFFELLARAGGMFVPEDAAPGRSIEPEELAQAAPDVYFATPESRVSLAVLSEDDDLATLPAVISERIVIIDPELFSVSGPDIIPTIEELADILHPAP